MKSVKKLAGAALAAVFIAANMLSTGYCAPTAAVVTVVKGDVKIQAAKKTELQAARVGMFLYEGDTIKTGRRAQIAVTFTNGTVLKLNQNTEFTIDVTDRIEKLGSVIKMKIGQLWSKVRPRQKFEVRTPVAIVAVRGTEFETNLGGNQLNVTVYAGTVTVTNDKGEVDVNQGQQTNVTGGNAPEPPSNLQGGQQPPAWQQQLESSYTIKLQMAKTSFEAMTVNELTVAVYDAAGNAAASFADAVTVKSDMAGLMFSADAAEWKAELAVTPVNGKAAVKVKALNSGAGAIAAFTPKAEPAELLKIEVSKPKTRKVKVTVETDKGREELLLKLKQK